MYRPQIKVVDCTIRDGGLMNKWQFEDDLVERVYRANTDAGIDYMEIGYLSSESAFDRKQFGPWRFFRKKICSG
jgi:4-hydroxy 2-oxovalerate aldolase